MSKLEYPQFTKVIALFLALLISVVAAVLVQWAVAAVDKRSRKEAVYFLAPTPHAENNATGRFAF